MARWISAPTTSLLLACTAAPMLGQMQVVATSPARHAIAPLQTVVEIAFDRAVDPASVDASTVRVFGRASGAKTGPLVLSNADHTVTLHVVEPFSAGETVLVNLSHDLRGADSTPLRSAGFAYAFLIESQAASLFFTPIQVLSTRSAPLASTTIYGTLGSDLNADGAVDLTTINEGTADLRVFLNRADGSGLYDPYLTPPVPAGSAASPHAPADFDNDGRTDIAVAAPGANQVFVALGNGDGTFPLPQAYSSGTEPRGIAVLDVDGDADLDIVNANHQGVGLTLRHNNGNGIFGAPTSFNPGFSAAWALRAADMNNDDITDLIVGGRDTGRVAVMLGTGASSFTAFPSHNGGGWVWHLAIGDVDGDGILDVATANSINQNGAILYGNGDGTLDMQGTYPVSGFAPSTDLGDLDGDGDLDWILSGGDWRVFTNNGNGEFTFQQDIPNSGIASCATLADIDNDGDVDLALSDELEDTVTVLRNGAPSPLPCPATPPSCRLPTVGGKALLKLEHSAIGARKSVLWKWVRGAATDKAEFGDPMLDEHYSLCMYDAGTLISTATAEAGGTCAGGPCWRDQSSGYQFRDGDRDPFGVEKLQLRAGAAGRAKIIARGRGVHLQTSDLTGSSGPIDVRLVNSTGAVCWGATYSAPFIKNDGGVFKDKAD